MYMTRTAYVNWNTLFISPETTQNKVEKVALKENSVLQNMRDIWKSIFFESAEKELKVRLLDKKEG